MAAPAVMTSRRQRTKEEFATLLVVAGFRLDAVTRTGTPLCIIEGAAV